MWSYCVHQLAERGAALRERHREDRRRQVDRGEQQALVLELADLERLVRALPAGDRLSKIATTLTLGCIDRLWPSWPDGERKPERASSAGVWIAPHDATTSLARTVIRCRVPLAPCPITPVARLPWRVMWSTRTSA